MFISHCPYSYNATKKSRPLFKFFELFPTFRSACYLMASCLDNTLQSDKWYGLQTPFNWENFAFQLPDTCIGKKNVVSSPKIGMLSL